MSHTGSVCKALPLRLAVFVAVVRCWMPIKKTVWEMVSQPVVRVFGHRGSSSVRSNTIILEDGMLTIKVLGSGCANCHKVEELDKQAVSQLSIDASVEMVTDMKEIMRYGVMSTPGLVINERVVSAGRVPSLSQVTTMVTSALALN
jgi:small redox-active disulfide protein 2